MPQRGSRVVSTARAELVRKVLAGTVLIETEKFFLGRTQSLQLWGYGLGSKNVTVAIISISLKSRFAIMCVNLKISFVKLVGRCVDIVSSFLSTTTNSQAHSCMWGARNKSLQGNVH